jgi:hypothetical protein
MLINIYKNWLDDTMEMGMEDDMMKMMELFHGNGR